MLILYVEAMQFQFYFIFFHFAVKHSYTVKTNNKKLTKKTK